MLVRDGMSDVSVTVGPSHTLRQAAEHDGHKVGAAWSSTTRCRRRGSSPSAHTCSRSARRRSRSRAGRRPHERWVIAAAPDWSLERAAAEMSRRGVRHLVVYDGGRAGRRALDARHRPRLDLGGRRNACRQAERLD